MNKITIKLYLPNQPYLVDLVNMWNIFRLPIVSYPKVMNGPLFHQQRLEGIVKVIRKQINETPSIGNKNIISKTWQEGPT